MYYYKRSKRPDEHSDNKLVGAFVPTTIIDYLTLFSVADNCSKTAIIRPIIEEWYAESQKKFPESKLIEIIAENGYKICTENKGKKLRPMLKAQKKELQKRGLSDEIIDKIIKKIIYAKGKED